MDKIIIQGGKNLKGEITVQGSKNAVLPIIAASIINGGINIIRNCPMLKDVFVMLEILKKLGCKITLEKNCVYIDSTTINSTVIPNDLAAEMRSSIIFLGPLLARLGEVTISYPGGCEIGPRPIDLHIKALKKMGAKFHDRTGGMITCEAHNMKGCEIHLDYPSVGATENIILAAVFAKGETYIRNAAKEPEIVDLQDCLRKMGVNVYGAGSSIIKIEGTTRKLKVVDKTIMSDRIVAGTYMGAAAISRGDIVLRKVTPEHIRSIIYIFKECGCRVKEYNDTVHIIGPDRPMSIDTIRTLPYPGFPTDMQAQIGVVLTVAKGTSIIVETVFENRYNYLDELIRMGAEVKVEGRIAVIKGISKLSAANVVARDLRGGAALVLAGLRADGTTVVDNISHIERGYEDIVGNLKAAGASINILKQQDNLT